MLILFYLKVFNLKDDFVFLGKHCFPCFHGSHAPVLASVLDLKVLILLLPLFQSSLSASHHVTAEEMRDHQVTYFDEISQGDDHQIMRSPSISSKPSIQQDWVLLAAAIDRILFLVYFFLFSVLAIVYAL